MKKQLITAALMASTILGVNADPVELIPIEPDFPIPDNPDNQRGPIAIPEFDLTGFTLTAGSYTLGSTIQLLDENDNVVFSTYVNIEGNIQLPTTLSGTYTILVIRDGQNYIGEITL